MPKAQAYSVTMYIMCGLLLIGFLCNFAMRAVNEKYHYQAGAPRHEGSKYMKRGWIMWLVVGIPLLWGRVETLQNALKLFQ